MRRHRVVLWGGRGAVFYLVDTITYDSPVRRPRVKDLSLTVAADRYGLTSMRGGSLVDVELESDFATLSGPGPFKASG